jgi:D-glycero-D-manno-heptose 1,7-bisphosphate phosphatase
VDRSLGVRAVFLDRDGVLNRALVREGRPYPPTSIDELEILPGVERALAALSAAGFRLIVVSNQPDVARGTTSREAVEAINRRLAAVLPIDRFIVCYHDSGDGCACRKPRPGMLHAGAKALGVDLAASYMVGDRWRDVEAGEAAGCRTIVIHHGYAERQPSRYDARVASLEEAAQLILEGTAHGQAGR